jgi:hypothetical protein
MVVSSRKPCHYRTNLLSNKGTNQGISTGVNKTLISCERLESYPFLPFMVPASAQLYHGYINWTPTSKSTL